MRVGVCKGVEAGVIAGAGGIPAFGVSSELLPI